MITYICHNRNEKTTEKQPCFGTVCETSTCQCCGGRADVQSTIYWCRQCNVPLYGNRCSRCGMEAKKLTTDVRPVFHIMDESIGHLDYTIPSDNRELQRQGIATKIWQIIPYQVITGNYNPKVKTAGTLLIIPYQVITGNYNKNDNTIHNRNSYCSEVNL